MSRKHRAIGILSERYVPMCVYEMFGGGDNVITDQEWFQEYDGAWHIKVRYTECCVKLCSLMPWISLGSGEFDERSKHIMEDHKRETGHDYWFGFDEFLDVNTGMDWRWWHGIPREEAS